MIFWLFAALAAATALGLWLFSLTDEGSRYKTVVWRALAGDLAIPVLAWFILHGIAASGRRRWAWWLSGIPAAGLSYAVVAATLGVLQLP